MITKNLTILFPNLKENPHLVLEARSAHDTLKPYDTVRVVDSWLSVTPHSLVVPRHLGKEARLWEDPMWDFFGAKFVNVATQRRYINQMLWYVDLKKFTPKSWFFGDWDSAPENGKYVVKGLVDGAYKNWLDLMYAPSLRDAKNIAEKLKQFPEIFDQGLVLREFEDFKKISTGLCGEPIFSEGRVFVLGPWSFFEEKRHVDFEYVLTSQQFSIASLIGRQRVAENSNFFCVDFAINQKNRVRIVDINDGSNVRIPPEKFEQFYSSLANTFFCHTIELGKDKGPAVFL